MRVPTSQRLHGVSFNMTPIIDVVFLLIIFFLVSSHLAQQEVQLDLDLPTATTGGPPAMRSPTRVTVNVLADGQVLLGSDPVNVEQLGRRLQYVRRQAGSDLEVRLRSDRHVPYRHVELVLVSCAQNGIWNVTFAVIRTE